LNERKPNNESGSTEFSGWTAEVSPRMLNLDQNLPEFVHCTCKNEDESELVQLKNISMGYICDVVGTKNV
jgi:hypothetical protein